MKKIYFTTGVLAALLLSSLTTFAQSNSAPSRKDLLKEIDAKHKELAALEKSFLEPAEEDRAKYADFLRTPNTGLMRLLPRENYDNPSASQSSGRTTVTPGSFSRTQTENLPQGQQVNPGDTSSVQPDLSYLPDRNSETTPTRRGLTLRGGGAYYSFTHRTHEYGYATDIELQRGELSSGFAGVNFGLMATLGDVPLETLGLELPEVNVLATYKPPSKEPEARLEKHQFNENTEIDGLKVKRRQSMREGSTYLLRSFNYGQSDVLVAFRVVRVDSDGSAIILWKLLKKYPTPQLARN